MFGYIGKLLFVDLTTGAIEVRPLDEALAKNFVGGPSLGAKILYDEMPAHTDRSRRRACWALSAVPATARAL
jgi:aldehyde:ferredoxin oxidoreductase